MITGTAGVSPLRLLRSAQDRSSSHLGALGWRRAGRDSISPPALFVLRVSGPAGEVSGLVARFEVTDPPQAAGLLPHERTDPRAVRRRLRALRSAHVDRDPLLLTHRDGGRVRELVAGRTRPVTVHHATSGTRVHVEQVDDDTVVPVVAALTEARLLVADGHHRLAASVSLVRDGGPAHVTGFVVDADDTPFRLEAIHRVLLDEDGRERVRTSAVQELLERCRMAGAHVEPLTPSDAPATDVLGDGPEHANGGVPGGSAHVAAVVVARRRDRWAVSWPGHPATDVTTLVDNVLGDEDGTRTRREPSGRAALGAADRGAVGVLLPAPSLDEVIALAERDVLLPYKATAFEPKVPSGVLVRPLPAWDAEHAADVEAT